MQEYHVTAGGRAYALEQPFFVLATQNPIEQEGTYPLPEAQLDRFMFNIVMDYLSEDDEVRVVTGTTGTGVGEAGARASAAPTSCRSSSRWCGTSPCRTTWPATPCASWTPRGRRGRTPADFVKKWVKWGAGLRASQALILAGKARALLGGRFHVSVADIRALAPSVLRHRIIDDVLRRRRADHARRRDLAAHRGRAGAQERALSGLMADAALSRSAHLLDPAVVARLGTWS